MRTTWLSQTEILPRFCIGCHADDNLSQAADFAQLSEFAALNPGFSAQRAAAADDGSLGGRRRQWTALPHDGAERIECGAVTVGTIRVVDAFLVQIVRVVRYRAARVKVQFHG